MNIVAIGIRTVQTIATAAGLFFVIMNWAALAHRRSWIPFVGGGLLALVMVSQLRLRPFFWLPLLLDLGCIPGFGWTLVAWIRRRKSRGTK